MSRSTWKAGPHRAPSVPLHVRALLPFVGTWSWDACGILLLATGTGKISQGI